MGSAVKSPCVNECIMDDNGVCTACGMTDKESNTWYKLSDEERLKIVERLAAQKKPQAGGTGSTQS
ncbi:MAG: DUF1289 domain-containing protein [Gammaproteobacteria bacterium]